MLEHSKSKYQSHLIIKHSTHRCPSNRLMKFNRLDSLVRLVWLDHLVPNRSLRTYFTTNFPSSLDNTNMLKQ